MRVLEDEQVKLVGVVLEVLLDQALEHHMKSLAPDKETNSLYKHSACNLRLIWTQI